MLSPSAVSTLSDRLDDYAVLPPPERAEVDREVAASGSPDDARRLADARRFAALLDAADDARPDRPVSPGDVADLLADRSLGLGHAHADRIQAAIDADPDLQAEADRVQARLGTRSMSAEAQAARFDAIFGTPESAPELAAVRAPRNDRARASDRQPAAPPRARLASARRVLVLAVGLVVAYGGLFAVSASQQTDRARVADLRDLGSYTPVTTRGAAADDPLPARLDAALDAVVASRRTTLGLFPRLDAEALDVAADELAEIVRASGTGTTVSQEARLALARVRVAQDRDAEVVSLLGSLVRDESYRAPEARRLLDFIRTQ